MFQAAGLPAMLPLLGLGRRVKTGNEFMDAIITIILPLVATSLIPLIINGMHMTTISITLYRLVAMMCGKTMYTRIVSYHATQTEQGNFISVDEDSQNNFLIKAIKLYLHNRCNLTLNDANVTLIEQFKSEEGGSTSAKFGAGNLTFGSLAAKRAAMKATKHGSSPFSTEDTQPPSLIKSLMNNRWYEAGVFDGERVYIMFSGNTGGKSGGFGFGQRSGKSGGGVGTGIQQKTEINLMSTGQTSCDAFLKVAHEWYTAQVEQTQKGGRYFFDLKGFDGRDHHRFPTFMKARLSDDKTFTSLFSHQFGSLINLVDRFQSRSGKYAIPGYPYKLGLLLSGPPGTGKTSFIKAIAHHTDRHIVTIPLSRVKTNQELMTLFLTKKYGGSNGDRALNLSYKDIVYVFEDIDASSDVVMARDLMTPPDAASSTASATTGTDTTTGSDSGSFEQVRPWEQPGHRPAGPVHQTNMNSRGTRGEENDGSDTLNLSGLLNVLDGIIDMPGRIIIMTTNRKCVLDPALIRPGRIDRQVELGYMIASDAIAMVEHYNQIQLTREQRVRIEQCFDAEFRAVDAIDAADEVDGEDGNSSRHDDNPKSMNKAKTTITTEKCLRLTPAELEHHVIDFSTVEEFMVWLEGKVEDASRDRS